ncbi:sigma-70 family RNA polymerase sigma factor [Idiomarina sp. HP20-50]|uniref:RNA polymerase sigma factor n=1 Tax=Idiomarina sp. HP20-50 TaxID=3070813 RepID=UPI00294B01AE|nr:sigma-70 family RNA polymerase sigma factor [Idiomarina sp. HP20-50]MDV6315605.1 sigma-70 family RNA polymerase sigma factor [Idiomarina sp. HP20-50]
MFKPSEKKQIRKALGGDQRAWLWLVQRYEKLVYHYGLRMLPSQADALDLLQDTFTSVFKSLANWREEEHFKAWLMTIAHHRCVEFYRRRKLEEQWQVESHDEVDEGDWSHPERFYTQGENVRRLLQAMQLLSIEQKAVVDAKFFQHLTLPQIAEQQRISVNTVKSRLYVSVDKLKQYLEEAHESSKSA